MPMRFLQGAMVSWSSCKCRSFGPSGSEYKYCAYPIPLFSPALKLTHEKSLRASLCAGTLSFTLFSENYPNHSGMSRNRSPRADSVSSFLSVFSVSVGSSNRSPRADSVSSFLSVFSVSVGSSNRSPRADSVSSFLSVFSVSVGSSNRSPRADSVSSCLSVFSVSVGSSNRSPRADSVSSFLSVFSVSVGSSNRSPRADLLVFSLRVVAGRNVETTESCSNDAGCVCVVELEELVDKPRTTIGP